MAKTVKQQSVKKFSSSTNPDRVRTGAHMRNKSTIKRLKMYQQGGKAIRDRKGHIVKPAPFQSWVKSGEVARVEPNKKWFGNTRVISQSALQNFQKELGKAMKDPYKVVMKQTGLPISLLQETSKHARVHLLDTESYESTFGPKAQRKKPQLTASDMESLVESAAHSAEQYEEEKDRDIVREDPDFRSEMRECIFSKGQSKRIWNELYKVIDSSDVVVQVLDARNPQGTRCRHVETYLRKEKAHKHLILLLNKCDLVPTWVTTRWITLLSAEYPTLAFHASLNNSFGKGSLIHLLRQFAKLHKDKQQISVGFIGYPNVGKSSIINTLRAKKVCNVAPIAGETKVWQYITLMRRIYLIDCPGVVYPTGDSDTDIVLKGVVRVENLRDPTEHIPAVLERVRPEYLSRSYQLSSWSNAEDFLEQLAKRMGRLLKGGEPDVVAVAKVILNDFQRGNLPYFVKPPNPPDNKEQDTPSLKTAEGTEAISVVAPQPTEPRQDEEPTQTLVTLANDSATGQLLMMETSLPPCEETASKEAQGPDNEQPQSEGNTGDGPSSKNEGPSPEVGSDEKQSSQMEGVTQDGTDFEVERKEGALTAACDSMSAETQSQDKGEQMEQAEIAVVDEKTGGTTPDDRRFSEADEKDANFVAKEDEPELDSEDSCPESGDRAMVDEATASEHGGFPHPHVSQNLTRLTLTSEFTEEDLCGPEEASGMQPVEGGSMTSPTGSESKQLAEENSEYPPTKPQCQESGSPLTSNSPSPDPYSTPSATRLGKLLESLSTPPSTAPEDPSSEAVTPSHAAELGGSDLNMQMLSSSDVPKVFMCGEVLPTKPEKKSRITPPAKLKGYGVKTKLKKTKRVAVQYKAASKKKTPSPSSSKHTSTAKRAKYLPSIGVTEGVPHPDLGDTSVEVIIPPDVDYSASKIFLSKSNTTSKKKHSMKPIRDFDYPTAYPLDSGVVESSKVPLILEVLPEASGSAEKTTALEKPTKQHKIGMKRKGTASEEPSSTPETTPGHLPSKAKKQRKTTSGFDQTRLRSEAKAVVPKSLGREPASKTDAAISKPPSSIQPRTEAPKTRGSIGRSKKGKKEYEMVKKSKKREDRRADSDDEHKQAKSPRRRGRTRVGVHFYSNTNVKNKKRTLT